MSYSIGRVHLTALIDPLAKLYPIIGAAAFCKMMLLKYNLKHENHPKKEDDYRTYYDYVVSGFI